MKWSIEVFTDRTIIHRAGHAPRTLVGWRHWLIKASLALLLGILCGLTVAPCVVVLVAVTR